MPSPKVSTQSEMTRWLLTVTTLPTWGAVAYCEFAYKSGDLNSHTPCYNLVTLRQFLFWVIRTLLWEQKIHEDGNYGSIAFESLQITT